MESVATLAGWLKRGQQRAAVARALRKPMTGSEICVEARRWTPRIQLRDVWFLTRQLTWRGLVIPLNRHRNSGRLYAWTELGRSAVAKAFDLQIPPVPTEVNWRKYADVVRAKTRRIVLDGLGQTVARTRQGQTATGLRRHLREHHSIGLNPVLRSLHELEALGLVRVNPETLKEGRKQYEPTPCGWKILKQLRQ